MSLLQIRNFPGRTGLRETSETSTQKGGYCSSRLNQQYRVIYQAEGDRLKVYVVEVTPHDYRRKF